MNIITINENKYLVKRIENDINLIKPIVELIKEYVFADIIFQTDDQLYFCSSIPDVIFFDIID